MKHTRTMGIIYYSITIAVITFLQVGTLVENVVHEMIP